MNIFKKFLSLGMSFFTAITLINPSSKAEGGEYKEILTSPEYKKISLDVDVLVLQTPGTDATKFLKRFFDKDAPYYEKDEFGQTTGVIDHSSLTHPKKIEMIKSSLDPVEDWGRYPDKDFYEEIDKDTFKFKCEYREESENMGKELYIYNTTFKIFRINDVREIYNPSPKLVEQIKKSNSIFELFDLKNKDGFFTIENVTGVINGMRTIDPEHYDMPVLDNCEIRQIDFQLQMHEFEQYFLDKCCNYTFFNHDSGKNTFIAYWNYLTRGGRLYHEKKNGMHARVGPVDTVTYCKKFAAQNIGWIIGGTILVVGVGLIAYHGMPALHNYIENN